MSTARADNLQNSELLRIEKLMQGLRSQIPPPNNLVAFEAAARHLSFTKAADELLVTRVAVSQQIKSLEQFLGTQLFNRLHRALSLTTEGERLYDVVSTSLHRILAVTTAIRDRNTDNQVTVTASTGVTTFWLLPRIGEFRTRHADFDLRFLVSDTYLDLSAGGADVAIRYGDGRWPGCNLTFLTKERIYPVCSPQYLDGRKIRAIQDLANETLLFLEGRYDPQTKWSVWFREHGVDVSEDLKGIHLNAYTNLVQATLEGQGIALIGPPLVDSFVASGALTRVLDVPPVDRRNFYLALPKDTVPNTATVAFCEWVVSEFKPNKALWSLPSADVRSA